MPSLLTSAKLIAVPSGFQGYFFFRPFAFLMVASSVLLHVICALPLLLIVYIPFGLALPHIEFALAEERNFGGILAKDRAAAEAWYLRAARPGLFAWENGHPLAARQLAGMYATAYTQKQTYDAINRSGQEAKQQLFDLLSAAGDRTINYERDSKDWDDAEKMTYWVARALQAGSVSREEASAWFKHSAPPASSGSAPTAQPPASGSKP